MSDEAANKPSEQTTGEAPEPKPEEQPPIPPAAVIKGITDVLMQHIPAMADAWKQTKRSQHRSQAVIHACTAMVCFSIVGVAWYSLRSGNCDVAERIIVPLITFLGGLMAGKKSDA